MQIFTMLTSEYRIHRIQFSVSKVLGSSNGCFHTFWQQQHASNDHLWGISHYSHFRSHHFTHALYGKMHWIHMEIVKNYKNLKFENSNIESETKQLPDIGATILSRFSHSRSSCIHHLLSNDFIYYCKNI